MTDLMGSFARYFACCNDISRNVIGGEGIVSGALFTLYFYSIGLSDCPRPYRSCPRRGGVGAAQAEATSAGVNIVDDYNTITHTPTVLIHSTLRVLHGFILSIWIYCLLTCHVQLCRELLTVLSVV